MALATRLNCGLLCRFSKIVVSFTWRLLSTRFTISSRLQRLTALLRMLAIVSAICALAVAPAVECVNTTADEHKALVFDKFVVDGLRSYVLAAKVAVLDVVCDFREVHGSLRFLLG